MNGLSQPNVGEDVTHYAIQHRVLCFGKFRVHSIWGGNSGLKRRGGRRRMWRMQKTILMIVAVALVGCASTPLFNPNNKDHVAIEKEIRKRANKPTGELTKADFEKVTRFALDRNGLTNISPLARLTQLEDITLSHNNLTDVSAVEGLTQLRRLNLKDNQLTDGQLKHLAGLKQLVILDLYRNQFTDISALAGLTQLESLNLDNNPDLTKAQIAELQKALPKCKIRSNAKK